MRNSPGTLVFARQSSARGMFHRAGEAEFRSISSEASAIPGRHHKGKKQRVEGIWGSRIAPSADASIA